MQHVEVSRHFPAPPQAVFDAYSDHARWSEWAGVGPSRLERPGHPHRNGVGALRVFGSGLTRACEEVLEFEPPKRLVYRVVRAPVPIRDHRGEVRFEPEGDGTRVVWSCRFESRIPGLGGLLRRFFTGFFAKALDGLARHSFPDAGRAG